MCIRDRVISEETSKKVRDALETVVTDGGGKNAYIDGYRIGGKTGTAQKAVNGSYVDGGYILSFVGAVSYTHLLCQWLKLLIKQLVLVR